MGARIFWEAFRGFRGLLPSEKGGIDVCAALFLESLALLVYCFTWEHCIGVSILWRY